jgi:hypothetical protein
MKEERMLEGGCLCGAVRYRIDGPILVSGICHCRTCRKVASAPSLPFVSVPAAAFAIVEGAPAETRSSPPVTRSFCAACGSPLTYKNIGEPDTIDVMTVSLDHPEAAPPTLHVWTSEKLAWEVIADGLKAYPRGRSEGR